MLSHPDFLRDRLCKLYPDPAQAEVCFNTLMQVIEVRLAQRSPALKALDAQRASQPDWYCKNHFMAYSTYVDKLANNLQGVRQKIPYLKSLGVNYLHLLPFLKMRPGQNDGGFAVEDFLDVEPCLGSIEDLQQLTADLRSEGISLCADLVLNHIADTHAWAISAKQGDKAAQDMFYWVNDSQRLQWETTLPQIFPQTAPGNFVWVEEVQQYVWSTFYPYQWDLNYSNPAVLVNMADTLLQLANWGVEVFRLDSAAFLWKAKGTSCMNRAECHWILQCLRAVVEMAAPGVLLKAEAIVPTSELPPYFGLDDALGRECHLAYQSSMMAASWYCLVQQDAQLLSRMMQHLPNTGHQSTWITYVRCHDDIGWNVLKPELDEKGLAALLQVSKFLGGQASGTYANGRSFQAHDPEAVHGTNGMLSELVGFQNLEDALGWQRYKLMSSLPYVLGGIPMVYMGDELAQANAQEDAEGMPAWTDGRDLHRPYFDESLLQSDNDSGIKASHALSLHRRMRQIHRQHLLAHNTNHLTPIHNLPKSVLGFFNSQVRCVMNFSAQAQTLDWANLGCRAEHVVDLITDQRLTGAQCTLAPYGCYWIVDSDPS